MKKIDMNEAFSKVPFWVQIITWLFTINVISKFFEAFVVDNILTQILEIIVEFILGITIIIFISKRIPKK